MVIAEPEPNHLCRAAPLQVIVGIQGRSMGCVIELKKKEDPFASGYGVVDSINFGAVKVGSITNRVFCLYNRASVPCRFCFPTQVQRRALQFVMLCSVRLDKAT